MKRIKYASLILFVLVVFSSNVNATGTYKGKVFVDGDCGFSDENFYRCLYDELANPDGSINPEYIDEKGALTRTSDGGLMSIKKLDCSNRNISDLRGIDYLYELVTADFSNNNINYINFGKWNKKITSLQLSNNSMSSIDLSYLTSLTYLDLSNNPINIIDVSKNPKLQTLDLTNTMFSTNICDELSVKNCKYSKATSNNSNQTPDIQMPEPYTYVDDSSDISDSMLVDDDSSYDTDSQDYSQIDNQSQNQSQNNNQSQNQTQNQNSNQSQNQTQNQNQNQTQNNGNNNNVDNNSDSNGNNPHTSGIAIAIGMFVAIIYIVLFLYHGREVKEVFDDKY